MPLMLQQKLISHRLAQLITHPFSRTCLADVLTIIISIIDEHTQIPFHYLVSYPDPSSTLRGSLGARPLITLKYSVPSAKFLARFPTTESNILDNRYI